MKKEAEPALTENVVIRVSAKEKALLEKHAKKEGWTLSEYIRSTMITDMALHYGDVQAMKIVFNDAREKLARKFNQKFRPSHPEKPKA